MANECEAALVIGIDQFILDRLRIRQNTEPAEWIFAVEHLQHFFDRRTADAVKAVAAGDEVAVDRPALSLRCLKWILGCSLSMPSILTASALEQDLRHRREPARDQILHDLLLAIDGDAAPDQLAEIDVVQLRRRTKD